MTEQIEDRFHYRGLKYPIVGASSREPFDPAIFGLKPAVLSTACWRGYQAVFGIVESRLALDTLHVNLLQPGEGYRRQEGPVINGVAPLGSKQHPLFNNNYEGINYPIEYTGGFLLADGLIGDLYEHVGFQAAWTYQRVVELVFDAGILRQEFDRSEQIKEVRRMILESRDENGAGRISSADELARFVGRVFAHSYNM
ncbi:hypothetical protein [Zavarzinella formosa]|uniref:hypothetical protein n=1 Tax=Zavarzinella formosa TaxID=360055 RepID=UPI0002D9591C|nr:hypothetical protein [Zavarzinella formosa]